MLASQVSSIAPLHAGRWSHRRRIDFAWHLLSDLEFGTFITHRYPVENAAGAFALIDRQPDQVIQVLLTYGRKTAND